MKTLYLIRHSKSDWGNEHLTDIDRPLNERGYGDAHKMSLFLQEKNERPDIILTSNAIRAMSTALIFMRNLNVLGHDVKVNEHIYEATSDELLNIIQHLNDKYSTVFLFCHNPGITQVVNRICNAAIDNIPTTGIACIDIESESWKKAGEVDGVLRYFEFPKKSR